MTDQRPPVRDWATDFDHTDPAWAADPAAVTWSGGQIRGPRRLPVKISS
jgi:hypothetical protein